MLQTKKTKNATVRNKYCGIYAKQILWYRCAKQTLWYFLRWQDSWTAVYISWHVLKILLWLLTTFLYFLMTEACYRHENVLFSGTLYCVTSPLPHATRYT